MDEKAQKLLRLAGSDNDNEALAALRALKRHLAKDGKNWNEFINSLGSESGGLDRLTANPKKKARSGTEEAVHEAYEAMMQYRQQQQQQQEQQQEQFNRRYTDFVNELFRRGQFAEPASAQEFANIYTGGNFGEQFERYLNSKK